MAQPGAAVLRRPVLVAVLDSGATIHLFSDGQFLSNTQYLNSPKPILVADGRKVYAFIVGDIDTEAIKLKNVYLVPDLKMNLVSVRELAKAGIITTFYKDHAELKKEKGMELVGGAIAQGDTSLYELTFLWATGDGDASDDTSPVAPSGSEPWMMTAVNGSNLPYLEEVKGFIKPADADFGPPKKYFGVDFDVGLQQKFKEYLNLTPEFMILEDTVKPEYIQYIKAHLGPDPDGMNEVDFMKSLKD